MKIQEKAWTFAKQIRTYLKRQHATTVAERTGGHCTASSQGDSIENHPLTSGRRPRGAFKKVTVKGKRGRDGTGELEGNGTSTDTLYVGKYQKMAGNVERGRGKKRSRQGVYVSKEKGEEKAKSWGVEKKKTLTNCSERDGRAEIRTNIIMEISEKEWGVTKKKEG